MRSIDNLFENLFAAIKGFGKYLSDKRIVNNSERNYEVFSPEIVNQNRAYINAEVDIILYKS